MHRPFPYVPFSSILFFHSGGCADNEAALIFFSSSASADGWTDRRSEIPLCRATGPVESWRLPPECCLLPLSFLFVFLHTFTCSQLKLPKRRPTVFHPLPLFCALCCCDCDFTLLGSVVILFLRAARPVAFGAFSSARPQTL